MGSRRVQRILSFVLAVTCLTSVGPAAASSRPSVKAIASFNGPDGDYAWGGLILATDGNFYGTTETGGNSTGYGTAFRMSPDGTITTLHEFSGPDGLYPFAGLTQGPDGNFYGNTAGGGAYGQGEIFKITQDGAFSILHSFNGSDGYYPGTSLVKGTDGALYGVTDYGGLDGCDGTTCGTIFKITLDGTLTTLHDFAYDNNGFWPGGKLMQAADGNFYGTAAAGGAYDKGTVFKLSPAGEFTLLYTFTGQADGGIPTAGLTQGADGNFYGTTTQNGGPDLRGTIFKMTLAGALTVLHEMATSDGTGIYASLVQGSNGTFYGTAPDDGNHQNKGTLFSITSDGQFKVEYDFRSQANGVDPESELLPIPGSDGLFYGTTLFLGASGYGTVYSIQLGGKHPASPVEINKH